jgi:predicted nucleotide-binding protein
VAHLDPGLILRLRTALGVSRSEIYRRIEQIVNTFHIERRLAALLLAGQQGVNTTRYATSEDRTALRDAMRAVGSPGFPATEPGSVIAGSFNDAGRTPVPPRSARTRQHPARAGGAQGQRGANATTKVWLVHGRNTYAANELRKLLRALGLNPMEWNQALARAREGSPYVGSVLDKAFGAAAATVVLMTPDDEARLRAEFRTASDGSHERRLTPQPRANVLWEGGMAFGREPRSAVLVQMGQLRGLSDIAGRHVVHFDGSPQSRRELATKLKAAGCAVDTEGTDWLSHGDFSQPVRRARRRPRKRKRGAR